MKNLLNKYYIIFFCLCCNFALFAQPGVGNETNDLENADAPAAPISDYLWVLALAGLILVFVKLKSVLIKMNESKSMIPLECKNINNLKNKKG